LKLGRSNRRNVAFKALTHRASHDIDAARRIVVPTAKSSSVKAWLSPPVTDRSNRDQ
jgi:hypothetical protein